MQNPHDYPQTKYKILTLNTISQRGLAQFSESSYEINSDINNIKNINLIEPDAILVRSHPMHDMALPNSVKIIGRAGTGTNNIPVHTLTQRGIPVLNTPGANANAVKELVVLGMLLACRHACAAWDYVRHLQGDDHAIHTQVENNKKQFVGSELAGKTFGVVGLGSVGVKIANTALAFGMRVIGYDPSITVKNAWQLSSEVKQTNYLDQLVTESDFITLHVPLIDETHHMIHSAHFHLMKPHAVLLNFARDAIIEPTALEFALQTNQLGAYVCDFPTAALKNHPRVVSLPHLGASTQEAEENCAVMIAEQVKDYLENGHIHHSVNFPSIDMPWSSNTRYRLAIANTNTPNRVAQISAQLGDAGINIINLLNKSRDEIAYTLIDLNTDIGDILLKKIARLDGILTVRKLNRIIIK